ncbi:hypothetical protein GWK47_039383 [Chionoecetes opilio]|uniref:Uncharacterized protein n=1 Tax=Chionoecetes opilio TaxID=41210 RepID=A0A8J4YLV7_CHIOP|nr:hypothetical protein GWK47_039383 [Chionoecetes opilio]
MKGKGLQTEDLPERGQQNAADWMSLGGRDSGDRRDHVAISEEESRTLGSGSIGGRGRKRIKKLIDVDVEVCAPPRTTPAKPCRPSEMVAPTRRPNASDITKDRRGGGSHPVHAEKETALHQPLVQ